MSPPLKYRRACILAAVRKPTWVLTMLHDQHGSLHDPCPTRSRTNGLQAPWSSSNVNIVNPPFSNSQAWLHKAVSGERINKLSIVLLPFCPHTKYMWDALHHAVSVCVLSQSICFETPFGEWFSRPLPTPVCLMSFGPELAPVRSSSSLAPRAYAVRLRNEDASIQDVVERVQERTGGSCTVLCSPIAGAAARTAQQAGLHRSAVPGTYRMHRTATACACM